MDGSSSRNETGENEQIPTWIDELSTSPRVVDNGLSRCFIYKVPSKLRVNNIDKFEPRVVSIGPYHINMLNMEVSNNVKELLARSLVSRITRGQRSRKDILKEMWKKISELKADFRKCYLPQPDQDDENFVKMLILDGCFVLELLYQYQLKFMGNPGILFQNNWMIPCVQQDLVLLENQIPYSVLITLFELVPKVTLLELVPQVTSRSWQPIAPQNLEILTQAYRLKELILHFFDPILPTTILSNIDPSTTDRHLLDLLRTHLLSQHGTQAQTQLEVGDDPIWEHTTCATDLQNAGVSFKRKETCDGMLDITFSDETLEIPPFYFGKSWAILFLNMIALEQCRPDYQDKITSYAILMDNLINSGDDVKLLREKKIIHGSQEEDVKIAEIVNNLSKEAIYENFYYDRLCSRLNAYRKKKGKRWRAAFYRNYIHTPWAGVSLIGALILLVLAFIQTVFTILSWKLAFDDGKKQ